VRVIVYVGIERDDNLPCLFLRDPDLFDFILCLLDLFVNVREIQFLQVILC
jgi:hypothetical protein